MYQPRSQYGSGFGGKVLCALGGLLWGVASLCAATTPASDASEPGRRLQAEVEPTSDQPKNAKPQQPGPTQRELAGITGSGASKSPAQWLETYRQRALLAPAECSPVAIPQLRHGTPATALSLRAQAEEVGPVGRVVYAEDTVLDRLIVLSQDDRGCVHVGESGRLLAFSARGIPSPLPNSEIPAELGTTPPVAILEDAKTLRPWIGLAQTKTFQDRSGVLWVLLGVYAGLLSMLLLVGLGLALWQRDRLAWAYVFYVATFQVYQLQSFGLGPAWLPFWPGPEQANLMQALSIALLVTGIGAIVTAFVQPTGWWRRSLLLALTLTAVGPLIALWLPVAYRVGGLVSIVLIVLILILLIQRLRDGEPATRWFALGIAAMLIGAGIRSIAVNAPGAGMGVLVGFAFPVGNLLESTCWLIALAMRYSSERGAMLKQLRYDAIHDPLTGTYNRAYLRRDIQTALNLVRASPRRRFGLLFLDLDGFKRINDSLGHAMGDCVLAEVARTLIGLDLNGRAIGRFGGDEFLILMGRDAHWSVTIGSASALVERFKEPLRVDGQLVPVRASIGVVAITPAHVDVDQVIRDADTALYVAKRDGGGRYKVFEPDMRVADAKRAQLRLGLRDALERDQIEVHYQPIFDLGSLRPVGFEALMRWRHPKHGLLLPEVFLPLADEIGVLADLGGRVIDRVLAQINDWQQAGLWKAGEYVSINVASAQLVDALLVTQLTRALERWPVDPTSVRLEIDEAILSAHRELALQVLPQLAGRNLLVSVDNFGTGQSGLTLLCEIEPAVIKIDVSVIEGVANLVKAQNLARGIVALGNELGCMVVAEGIETDQQLNTLASMGCEYGQGFKLSAPMPANEVAAWVALWQDDASRIARTAEPRRIH